MEQRLKRILDKSTFNNLMRFDNRLAFFHLAVRIFVETGLVVGLALSSSNYTLIAILILVIGFGIVFGDMQVTPMSFSTGGVLSNDLIEPCLYFPQLSPSIIGLSS